MSKTIEKLNKMNDNEINVFSYENKIPYRIVKKIIDHSKKDNGIYTNKHIDKKPKIAITISGAFFQNDRKNENGQSKMGSNKPGYDYKYLLKIIRNQYEHYYDVDYYICGDYIIDESIFDGKLIKSVYFNDDEVELLPNIYNVDPNKHRRFSCQYYKKKKVFELIQEPSKYEFFIWTRADWIIILNGFGMLNREITLHCWRPLPLINKEYYENIPIRFENINKDCLYQFHSCYRGNNYVTHDTFALGNYNNMLAYSKAFDVMNEYGTIGLYKYLLYKGINLDYIDTIIVSDKLDNNFHLPTQCGYSKGNLKCICPLPCPVCFNCKKCKEVWCKHELEHITNILKKKYNL